MKLRKAITYSFNSSSNSSSHSNPGTSCITGSHLVNNCDFQLILFSSLKDYKSFTGSSHATPAVFEQNSTGFYIPHGPQNTSSDNFSFSIPKGGYFYFAGHISANILFKINITGNITMYDLSNATRGCSINKNNDHCEVDITGINDSAFCILSNSSIEDTCSINIGYIGTSF